MILRKFLAVEASWYLPKVSPCCSTIARKRIYPMPKYSCTFVSDGVNGQITFPQFITQWEMDILANEFIVQDDDLFVVTYPRSGTTWTEQIVHLILNQGEQGEQPLTDAAPWLETLPGGHYYYASV